MKSRSRSLILTIVRSRERTRIETDNVGYTPGSGAIVRSRERTRIETDYLGVKQHDDSIVRSRERTRIETSKQEGLRSLDQHRSLARANAD